MSSADKVIIVHLFVPPPLPAMSLYRKCTFLLYSCYISLILQINFNVLTSFHLQKVKGEEEVHGFLTLCTRSRVKFHAVHCNAITIGKECKSLHRLVNAITEASLTPEGKSQSL